MSEKAHLRKIIRGQRQSLPIGLLELANTGVAKQLEDFPPFMNAVVVGCYLSLSDEVPTEKFIALCKTEGKHICVPACMQTNNYRWCWLDGSTKLVEYMTVCWRTILPI